MENTTLNNTNIQEYEFTMKFGGSNSMELSSLAKILDNFSVLTKEASKNSTKCQFNIVAVNEGSFELLFQAFTTLVPVMNSLVTSENINYASMCMEIISEWFKVHSHLNCQPPKSIEKTNTGISVTNKEGEVQMYSQSVSRYLENANISNSIVNITTTLKEEDRDGFKINGKNDRTIINIDKNDYDKMNKKIQIKSKNTKYISYMDTNLLLQTAVFSGDNKEKWKFYLDKPIKAKIEDENWLLDFKNSKISLEFGTQFKVHMRIEISRDINGILVDNTAKYYIEEIFDTVLPSYDKNRKTK